MRFHRLQYLFKDWIAREAQNLVFEFPIFYNETNRLFVSK
jgi:hypothetical protein